MRFCSTVAITIKWELPLFSEVMLTLPASLWLSGCPCWSSDSEVGSAHGAASILPSPLGWAWWWGNLSFCLWLGLALVLYIFWSIPNTSPELPAAAPPAPGTQRVVCGLSGQAAVPGGDAGVKPVAPAQTMARLSPEPLRCPLGGGRNRI